MKKHFPLGIQILILAASFWVFSKGSPSAAPQLEAQAAEVQPVPERSLASEIPSVHTTRALPSPTPSATPAVASGLTLEQVEKILDDDEACAFYKIQESEAPHIREAVVKRLSSMTPVLFMSREELLALNNSPVPMTQLFLGLYHAGLLGGMQPPEVDYPLAFDFLQRGSAKQPENGVFYLYEAYLQFLMGNSPSLQKSLLMEAFHHPLFVSFTANLARQALNQVGRNATSWLATKIALTQVPAPMTPPILFYKLVLKDASTAEIDEATAWGVRAYQEPYFLTSERILGKRIAETFWNASSKKDQPPPQMPYPFTWETPFTNEAGIQQFDHDMRQSPCERTLLDRYYKYCRANVCPW